MNWGTKIVIGMAIFMAFIVGMGVKMIVSNNDDALVEKDYYEKGLNYSKEYEKETNAARDKVVPTITQSGLGLYVTFVKEAIYRIECKNVSDSKLDRAFTGKTNSENFVLIPGEELPKGRWRLKIQFASDEKNYQVSREITLP